MITHPTYPDGSPILFGDWVTDATTGSLGRVVDMDLADQTVYVEYDEQGSKGGHIDVIDIRKLVDPDDVRSRIESVLRALDTAVRAEVNELLAQAQFSGWLISAGVSWDIQQRSDES